MVTVTQAKTGKELKVFEKVGEKIHHQDPYFVPPFPGSIVKLVSPKGPFGKHGEVLCFVAWADGQPVGRIAAIENRSHNAHYGDKVGFFGFFDFTNDIEVAKALVETATSELKRRGLNVARGPYNPTSNDECGVLAEGFEAAPMVLMPYNPPYYLDIYEKLGFGGVRDLNAFYIGADQKLPDRIRKIAQRVQRVTGVTVRPVNMKHLERDLKIIQELYNETLQRNWGFVPLTWEDMQASAKDLAAIIEPSMVLIAEKDGQPAGFSMVIPNINEFMWRAKHSPVWLRVLKFVWWLKTSRPKEARLAVLGVKPEFLNKGIGALFYHEALVKGSTKYIGGELSWVEANNKEIIHGIEVMGARKYKNYRIYEKPLEMGRA